NASSGSREAAVARCFPALPLIGWDRGPGGAEVVRVRAGLAEVPEAEGIVPLGEAGAFFVRHEGAMEELGRRPAESSVKEELAGGGSKEIGPADDFGDGHEVVVGDAGELVGGKAIVTPGDEIAKVGPGDKGLGA